MRPQLLEDIYGGREDVPEEVLSTPHDSRVDRVLARGRQTIIDNEAAIAHSEITAHELMEASQRAGWAAERLGRMLLGVS